MSTILAQVLWQSPAQAPTVIAFIAVLGAAVIAFYPPQTRGVPRLWRWVMPGVRTMAVVALALTVAQPVVLRPRTAARQGVVVVLIDRSHSMSVIDRERTPAELVSLAAGLGAIPADARPEPGPTGLRAQLDALRSLADQIGRARSEAEYARISGRGLPAAQARLGEVTARLRTALATLPNLPAAPQPAKSPPPASSAASSRAASSAPASQPSQVSPPELAKAVAELKRLPPVSDDAVLRTMRAALDSAGRAVAASQAQADERLFRADDSVRSACAALGARSRRDLLELGLTQQDGLLASLPAGTPLVGFTFAADDELRPMSLASGPAAGTIDFDATGSRSDIAGAIRATLARMAGRSLQAIVLVSDGRQVGGDAGELETAASDVSAAGVPVFAVQCAAAAGTRRDVAIVNVMMPDSARVGQIVPVRVDLRGPGFRAADVEVRLDADNVRQIRRVRIAEAAEATASADFEIQPSRGGPQSVVASVLPLGGETTDENNRFERWIRVGVERARVLVIAGPEPGRQYASMHASLSRCEWVSLREVEQDEVASLTPRAIEQQDVIVLADVPPFDLGEAQWTALERVTRQRGASVIVCPGKHAPAEYAAHAWANRLLPYESSRAAEVTWRTWPADEPQFRIVPAPGSSLATAPAVSGGDFWRQLAPLSRYVPLSPPPPLLPDARALLIERESGSAVLTEARRGLGRIYFLGTDQSWRWRGPDGADEREQFWPQMVRLAGGEPYAASHINLSLDADPIAPEPGQSFTIRARVYDPYGQPAESAAQMLHILRADGSEGWPVRDVMMSATGEASGRYTASVAGGLPAGRYMLRLEGGEDTSAEAASEPVELPLVVAPHLEAEMTDLSGDDRVLRRLANASGGQFLTLDQSNTLASRLAENRQKQSRLVEYALWDSPYLFGFVLACLSTEWALRKKFGLA
jgi:hypothetical protein